MPLHASNVMVHLHRCGEPTRIAHERVTMGADQKMRTRRVCKQCGKPIAEQRAEGVSRSSGKPTARCPRCKSNYSARGRAGPAKEFGYANVMQVPALHKIVINIGMGEAIQNAEGASTTPCATWPTSPASGRW